MVNRIVLGVPLCMWQTNLCTFRYVPAGHTHLIRNYLTHEEGSSGCFCAMYFTAILHIDGMLSQGYAEDNAATPWHKQAAREGDGCLWSEGSPEQVGLLHH